MPNSSDMPIYQGDDFNAIVTVMDSVGAPADLTGFTAQAQIRKGVADFDPVVAVEIEVTVVSPNVFLSIPRTITQGMRGNYVWDLQLVSSAGVVTTVLAGKVRLTQEVTREVGKGNQNGRIEVYRHA